MSTIATEGPAPLTRAAALGTLLRLAWPIAVAQMAMVSLGMVDVAVIGHSSVSDLAGAALARTIGYTCTAMTIGVAMALEPLASQALGAREPDRASAALRATVRATWITWPITMGCAFGIAALLPWVGVEADVVSRAHMYMLGQAPGFLFYGIFLAHKTFLQAHGHTRPALVAAFIASAVNVVVCSVLVRGDAALVAVHLPAIGMPPLGALGAGIASSIAFTVLAAIVYPASRSTRVRAPAVRVPIMTVFRIGIPVGLQIVTEMSVFALVAILAGRLGKEVVSAHQIAIMLASFTYMGSLGVSGATAVLVGRAIGARESPRLPGLAGISVGAVMMALPALVFGAMPRALASMFTSDEGVIANAIPLLRIAAVFQLFDGVQAVAGGALRGAADVRYAFVTNVVAYWIIGLPLALFLGFTLGAGAPGLWWGLTLGLVVASVILTRRFARLASRPIVRA